jgi:D-alanine-D-alanine ligase
MSASGSRVAVVYNEPFLPAGHHDAVSEADVVEVAVAVASALAQNGFDPVLLPAAPPLRGFLDSVEAIGPDLIFNLIEAFGGRSAGATELTAALGLLGIPYTGSSVEGFAACQSKARTKALLRGFGLPTAAFWLVEPGERLPELSWESPVIVKPDAEDGSLGIDQESVVTGPDQLAHRVAKLRRDHGGAVLIETYLPGPEFNVGVIALPEPRAFAVAQVAFAPRGDHWPILTYDAKWDEGSEADLSSPVVCPAPIDRELAERLSGLAVGAVRATCCRDYARVDFRLDETGAPMILEVNPNPDIGPRAGWARAAGVSGYGYAEAVAAIARNAAARAPARPV